MACSGSVPAASFALALALATPAAGAAAEPAADAEPSAAKAERPRARWREPPVPPRLDGTYLGFAIYGAAIVTRVRRLQTPGPFAGAGGYVRVGQMVLPWLGLGISVGGAYGTRTQSGARQRVWIAEMLVDGTFVPVPRIPFTLRTSFGFGGGAVREAEVAARSGYGGAVFGAALRYELFPGAKRYRPTRGGGFGIGPELGWIGATPAALGRPMANVVYLAISGNFYFGT
jgi:hypothetical protein